VEPGSVPLTVASMGSTTFNWTFTVSGGIACGNFAPCTVGSTGSGRAFWDINIKGSVSQAASIYFEPAPLAITATLWVDPDGTSSMPAMPLGEVSPGVAGPIYYQSRDWLEARVTFTNTSALYTFDISPVARITWEGEFVSGQFGLELKSPPTPSGPQTLSPGGSVTVTWKYARIPGGVFDDCIGGPGGVGITAAARGVCETFNVEMQDLPFHPYDTCTGGCPAGSRNLTFNAPSCIGIGGPFTITLNAKNSDSRPVVLDKAAPFLDLTISSGAPTWTPTTPPPVGPYVWQGGEIRTFTWEYTADTAGTVTCVAGIDFPPGPPVPCHQACREGVPYCEDNAVVISFLDLGSLTIVIDDFTASPALPAVTCDDPGNVTLTMTLRNTTATNFTVTSFCGALGYPDISTNNTIALPTGPPSPTGDPPFIIKASETLTLTWTMTAGCESNPYSFVCPGKSPSAAAPMVGGFFVGQNCPGGGCGSANASCNVPSVEVTRRADLTCDIWTDKSFYTVGVPITVSFSVSNTGGNDVVNFAVATTAAASSGAKVEPLSGPVPVVPGTFMGSVNFAGSLPCATPAYGNTEIYTFTFTPLKPGKATFTGLAQGNDAICGKPRSVSCTTPEIIIASAAQLDCKVDATPLVTMSLSCIGCEPQSNCNPVTGQGCITVTMEASNFGDVALINVLARPGFPVSSPTQPCNFAGVCPNVLPTLGEGSVASIPGMAPPEASVLGKIDPLGTASYTWTYSPSGLGCVQFLTRIEGNDEALFDPNDPDASALSCDPRTNCVEILPRYPVELRLVSAPENMAPGQTSTVWVEVCNPGDTLASMQGGEPTLQFFQIGTGANVTDQFDVIPPVPESIPVGECKNIPVRVTVHPGTSPGTVEIQLSKGDLFIAQGLSPRHPRRHGHGQPGRPAPGVQHLRVRVSFQHRHDLDRAAEPQSRIE